MYNVVQIGKKFIIRRTDQRLERSSRIPQESPGMLRIVQLFWTGTSWSTDPAEAKEFDTLVDAAVCHPPQ